jgi:hypothetical protein
MLSIQNAIFQNIIFQNKIFQSTSFQYRTYKYNKDDLYNLEIYKSVDYNFSNGYNLNKYCLDSIKRSIRRIEDRIEKERKDDEERKKGEERKNKKIYVNLDFNRTFDNTSFIELLLSPKFTRV